MSYEEDVRGSLIEFLNARHNVVNKFDPYSISKVLRYCLAFNDSTDGAVELYKSLSLLLTQTIIEREATFKDDVDTLIDLETKDILDIVRIYSAFSKNTELAFDHIPELFEKERAQDDQISVSTLNRNSDLKQMSQVVL